jgi:tetratricopeptide (TPR) repeat protein
MRIETKNGVPLSKLRTDAEEEGRHWLDEYDADVLIWGEVVKVDQMLRLWFTTSGDQKAAGASRYKLDETILPKNFHEDIAIQLVAVALTGVQPATERVGNYLAAILRPVAAKIRLILDSSSSGLTNFQKGDLYHAFGLAAMTVGDQAGNRNWLEQAVTAYRTALEERTQERVPLDWAATQNSLGNALRTLGEWERGTVRLEQAITAYRAALKERTRERVPLDWAATQNNLGNALLELAKREGSTARLEEAIAAYRAALEERTRERVPLDWAATQNNIGNAALRLAEREDGTARLEQAVAAYHAALEELTRERVPLDWAMAQNNLGNALLELDRRKVGMAQTFANDTARLKLAITAYRAALEERTRERVPLDWAATQNNLGSALRSLGERELGTASLQQAVAAYHAALEELTRERVPLDWAMTQNNLGNALRMLGEREGGTILLKQAIAAYNAALKEQAREQAPLDHAMIQDNLGIALGILGKRDKKADLLRQALTATKIAREIYLHSNVSQYDFYFSKRIEFLESEAKALEEDIFPHN